MKIFSSRLTTPHLDVTPTLKGPYASSIFKPIYLAFLAPRGQPEHYDGRLLDRRSIYSEFGATDRMSDGILTDGNASRPVASEYDRPVKTSDESVPLAVSTAGSDCEHDSSGPQSALLPPCVGVAARETDNSDNELPSVSGVYVTPPKKRRGRKRAAHAEKWKRNVWKQLKLKGQKYTNGRGKSVEAKTLQAIDCSRCKLKCSDEISEEERGSILIHFTDRQL